MRAQLTFLLVGIALLTLTSCSFMRAPNAMDVEIDRQCLQEINASPE